MLISRTEYNNIKETLVIEIEEYVREKDFTDENLDRICDHIITEIAETLNLETL